MTYVPYSQVAPQTDDLTVLRAELYRVREVYGRGSSQGAEAYNRLSAAAARQGKPLGALHVHCFDETERFFSRTIAGPDGHTYWNAGKEFTRNDGAQRLPRRWWWEHVHGPLLQNARVLPVCGDRNCITVDHCAVPDHSERRKLYSDEQMLGALQVQTMRLGHVPSSKEWERMRMRPSKALYQMRFGTWENALRAAGLEYTTLTAASSPDAVVAAIRHARDLLGHWPSMSEIARDEIRAALHAAHLPTSTATAARHWGSWSAAVAAAKRT